MKFSVILLSLASAVLAGSTAAQAQSVNTKSLEQSKFYNASRQIQIIDDRPLVRDFREAPQPEQSIALPPPPAGFGGSGGRNSGVSSIPAGGLPLGGGPIQPRIANGGGLDRSGFGPTNIPNRGFTPQGLPNGTTTNRLMGQKAAPRQIANAPSQVIAHCPMRSSAPTVATYGGYGGSGFGDSGSHSQALVRGSLLRRD